MRLISLGLGLRIQYPLEDELYSLLGLFGGGERGNSFLTLGHMSSELTTIPLYL
jgi:hypothetical protein